MGRVKHFLSVGASCGTSVIERKRKGRIFFEERKFLGIHRVKADFNLVQRGKVRHVVYLYIVGLILNLSDLACGGPVLKVVSYRLVELT